MVWSSNLVAKSLVLSAAASNARLCEGGSTQARPASMLRRSELGLAGVGPFDGDTEILASLLLEIRMAFVTLVQRLARISTGEVAGQAGSVLDLRYGVRVSL